jgi:ABC-type uncharacterized transport system permease subunit
MLSGVSIVCFAVSYTVALGLEVSRLLFRSGIRGAAMLAFAGAGLLAHSAFLYHRVVNSDASPLSSQQDWFLVAAWMLVVVYLYLVYYHPKNAFGLFILPLVLGLIAAAALFADPQPYAREPASKIWGMIHGISILTGAVAMLIGFATGLMYLSQARRLKHKRPPTRGFTLPSLEWLQKANGRAIVVSVLMLGVGVLSGMILNRINGDPLAKPLPWTDPVVMTTTLMFAWLLVASGITLIYRPARAGHKVAYLTLASFVFLVIALGVGLLSETQHGNTRDGQEETRVSPIFKSGCEAQEASCAVRSTPWHNLQVELRGVRSLLPLRGPGSRTWATRSILRGGRV